MADFFWFSDEQWTRISPLLPVNGKGARRVDDRRVLSGIVHALQSGGRWGDCPEHNFGDTILISAFINSRDKIPGTKY